MGDTISVGPGIRPRWVALAFLLAASGAQGQSLALSHPVMIFIGRAGAGDPGPQRLSIRSTPPACGWTIPTTLPAWLGIAPAAGTGPGDAVLAVHTAALGAGYFHVQLTVMCGTESQTVEVLLVITDVGGNLPPPPPNIPIPPAPPGSPPGTPGTPPEIVRGNGTWARYLVEFTFIGYSGLINAYPHCQVNPNGIDHMIGVLTGLETSEQGVDVTYKGTMSRFTMIDFCDVKPRPGSPGENDYCAVSLLGTSTMRVEFEAYGEEGRGGWLKAAQAGTRATKQVGGTCDAEVTNNARNEYPGSDHGGGGSPSGQPIQDQSGGVGHPKLYSGGLARLRVGDYPAKDPESVWSMHVIARIVP